MAYMWLNALVLNGIYLFANAQNAENGTLELVHVLFRHGDRNPSQSSLYPSNPYYNESFYQPYGFGHLTNEGRRKAYKLGALLRQRYDSFLGDTYTADIVQPRSTRIERAKMSLEFLLASLFPPTGELEWLDGFSWQPIPYIYEPTIDKELYSSSDCSRFSALYNQLVSTPEVLQMDAENEWLYVILANNTGESISSISDVFFKFFGFVIQEELGFPLEAWQYQIYPEPMRSITIDYYYLMTNTTEMMRIKTGYLLREMLNNFQNKINGTLEPRERKLFLYSAHEQNLATFLITLGVYEPHLPPYSSYIILELHNVDGEYGIKLFYQDYSTEEPNLLQMPNCEELCNFDTFVSLMSPYIPTDEECNG